MAKNMKLTVFIGAVIAGLQRGLHKGVSGVKGFASKVKSTLGNVKNSISGMFGGLGIGLSTAGIVMGLKSLVDYGDAVGKTSKRIGITAEEFQKLSYAARREGASNGDIERSFKRMSKAISDANDGLASSQRSLAKLGLTVDQLAGKSPYQQFELIASALAKVEDRSQKSAIAQELFGRAGTQLIPMLESYKKLGEEISSKGGIVSNESIKAAEDFKDRIEEMTTSIKSGLMNSGVISWLADMATKFNDVADAMREVEEARGKSLKGGKIVEDAGVRIASGLAKGVPFGGEMHDPANLITTAIGGQIAGVISEYSLGYSTDDIAEHNKEVGKRQAFQAKYDARVQALPEEKEKRREKRQEVQGERTVGNIDNSLTDYFSEVDAEQIKITATNDKVTEQISALKEKLQNQDKVNSKLERELAIQENIKQARKQAEAVGRNLSPKEENTIRNLTGKNYDLQHDSPEQAGAKINQNSGNQEAVNANLERELAIRKEIKRIREQAKAAGGELSLQQEGEIRDLAGKNYDSERTNELNNRITSTITQLKQRAQIQELINKGMKREAAIQSELNRARDLAKASGATLSPDKEKEIGDLAGKNYDLQNTNSFKPATRQIQSDSFAQSGLYLTAASSGVNNALQGLAQKRNNFLQNIEKKVDSIKDNLTLQSGDYEARWP